MIETIPIYNLIIEGNLDITNGTNFYGDTAISEKTNIIKYTMTNNKGNKYPQIAKVIDFSNTYEHLNELSQYWSNILPNAKVYKQYSTLILEGEDEDWNIFYLDDSIPLNSITGINIKVPSKCTILINVNQKNVNFGSYQIFLNGQAIQMDEGHRILWNLYNTTTIQNGSTAVCGTVLAVNADFESPYS